LHWDRWTPEQSIAEIEWLELIFAVPDPRPLSAGDLTAANRRHDEMVAQSPWFRLWSAFRALLPSRVASHYVIKFVADMDIVAVWRRISSGSVFLTP
jgi:hypothetical protein